MISQLTEYFSLFIDFILHMDVHLATLSSTLGVWMYVLLFTIIFCETGLIVTPFLPGDSLLFAVGALTAIEGSDLNIGLMAALLTFAAILGDNVNYEVGKRLGPMLFRKEKSVLFNKAYLVKAELFYEKYGVKAIILARFAPIFRTFVPFVAGLARMNRKRFFLYDVAGGLLWINLFLGAGYIFGNLPEVKRHFHIVIFAVILISLAPMFIEWLKHRKQKRIDHGSI
ncbi:MAG: DedA family protein [Bdellovibrionota bacterium]